MALFQKKRFVWNEPWFFLQKTRPITAWLILAILVLGIPIALGLVLIFGAQPQQGRGMGMAEIIGLCVMTAGAILFFFDGANVRRQAVLFEDSLIVGGDMGKYSVPTEYKLARMSEVYIVPPEVTKLPCLALCFLYDGKNHAIGIESAVSTRRMAQAFFSAGVPVQMADWQPNQRSEFEQTYSWTAAPNRIKQQATISSLPDGTTSMMAPVGILKAMFIILWPIVLWLSLSGYIGYYCYKNWNNLGLFQLIPLIGIPIGMMWLVGTYLERFGSAGSSKVLIDMAKEQLLKRQGVLITDKKPLIPVEVLMRDQFANSIQKIHEMGFLQFDATTDRVLYEGKKERWILPRSSINSVSIEEIQTGTAGQSQTGLLNFYVVINFDVDSVLELGLRYGEREYGEFNDIKRAEGAIIIYEAFEEFLNNGQSE
jgi:hypothetical protein